MLEWLSTEQDASPDLEIQRLEGSRPIDSELVELGGLHFVQASVGVCYHPEGPISAVHLVPAPERGTHFHKPKLVHPTVQTGAQVPMPITGFVVIVVLPA
jgi:hypothetical protein